MHKIYFTIISILLATIPANSFAKERILGIDSCDRLSNFFETKYYLKPNTLKTRINEMRQIATINSDKLDDLYYWEYHRTMGFDTIARVLKIDKTQIKEKLKSDDGRREIFRNLHIGLAEVYKEIPNDIFSIEPAESNPLEVVEDYLYLYNELFGEHSYIQDCGFALNKKFNELSLPQPSPSFIEIANNAKANYLSHAQVTLDALDGKLSEILNQNQYNPKEIYYYSEKIEGLISAKNKMIKMGNVDFFGNKITSKFVMLKTHLDSLKQQLRNPEQEDSKCLFKDDNFPFLIPESEIVAGENLQNKLIEQVSFKEYLIKLEVDENGKVTKTTLPDDSILTYSPIDKKEAKMANAKIDAFKNTHLAFEEYANSLQFYPARKDCKKISSTVKIFYTF